MSKNHLPRLKSLLNRTTLIAFAVASAHAATFNAPNPGTGPSPSYVDYDDDNCANNPSTSSAVGSVTNGGLGLTLSGNAAITGFGLNGGRCTLTMYWQGTGSGVFAGTTTITPNFTLTVPADVTITCTLTVFISGTQEAQYNCAEASPGGTFSLSPQTLPVPGTLSTYSVQLAIVATWTDTARTIFSVNVPSGASIDLLTGTAAPSATPAPSSLALSVTGILLLTLVGFGFLRRRVEFDSKHE
jgi:hypothetical protein